MIDSYCHLPGQSSVPNLFPNSLFPLGSHLVPSYAYIKIFIVTPENYIQAQPMRVTFYCGWDFFCCLFILIGGTVEIELFFIVPRFLINSLFKNFCSTGCRYMDSTQDSQKYKTLPRFPLAPQPAHLLVLDTCRIGPRELVPSLGWEP